MTKIIKPLKTTVVNLYGGPACGKSTASAYLFCLAKRNHIKCELVREYAKHYAWEGWDISHIDQFMIAGQQMKWEGMLWNKVRFIITDSPVILAAFYCKKRAGDAISRGLEAQINSYYELGRRNKVEFIHVNLNRVFDEYDNDGRYQDEETAKKYDHEIKKYVTDYFGVEMIESSAKPEALEDLAGKLGWVLTL